MGEDGEKPPFVPTPVQCVPCGHVWTPPGPLQCPTCGAGYIRTPPQTQPLSPSSPLSESPR